MIVLIYIVLSGIIMGFVAWDYRQVKRENLAERPAKVYNYKSQPK